MKTFIVNAGRTVYENFEVQVKAKSKEEAEQLVLDNISNGNHDSEWDTELINNVIVDAEEI